MLINNNLLHTVFLKTNNSIGNVVITHGIAEHHEKYLELANKLVDTGYNCFLYDLRGHGKSCGKRGSIKKYSDYANDLKEICEYIKSDNQKPIFLIGHSLGGLITNIFAADNKVDGIISLSAPTNYIQSLKPLFVMKIMTSIFRNKKLKTNFNDKKLSTKLEYDEFINSPYNLSHFTLSVPRAMIKGIKYLQANINRYENNILLLHGKKDELVSCTISENFFDKLKSNKKIIIYENSLHNLLFDVEKEQVTSDIMAWLKENTRI